MSHAKLGYGGSVAGRTLQCPGWVALAATLPPEALASGGPAADQGTVCHQAVELLVRGKVLKPTSLIGLEYNGQSITQETLDELVLPALHMFQEATPRDWQELFTEQRVDILTEVLPPGTVHGTADVVVLYEDRLVVGDWKFGLIPVPPNSAQLFFYAAGVLDVMYSSLPLDFPVILMVIQPRVSHRAQTYETTVEQVRVWKAGYELALHGSLQISPPKRTGPYCQFCPCKTICDTYLRRVRSLVSLRPDLLDPETLAELADGLPLTKGYTEDVSAELKRTLQAGIPVPGRKLIQGRARRTWRDEAEAAAVLEECLGEEAYQKKLLTPAAARGRLAALADRDWADSVLADLVHEGRDPPRVVPDTDPHPALDINVQANLTSALAVLLTRGKL